MPFTVPEGYFKSFTSRMMAELPAYPEKPEKKRLTAWQRMKPYVYLAAMFAGIWCMMQIFHRVSNPDTRQQENAMAYYEPDSYDFYLDNTSGQDLALEDEVVSLYPNFDDFKRDFYAQL